MARRLRSDGYRVRLLARKPLAARDRDPALEYVPGDLDDTDALRNALVGCAAVHVNVRGGPTAEQAIAASAVPSTIFRPTYFMDTLPVRSGGPGQSSSADNPHPFHMLAAADFARMLRGQPAPGGTNDNPPPVVPAAAQRNFLSAIWEWRRSRAKRDGSRDANQVVVDAIRWAGRLWRRTAPTR